MKEYGGKISLAILTIIYLLSTIRYFPGRPTTSLVATASHLVTVAPFLAGVVLIFKSFYHKQAGQKPALATMFRVGLTMGIIIEFFVGLFNYLATSNIG